MLSVNSNVIRLTSNKNIHQFRVLIVIYNFDLKTKIILFPPCIGGGRGGGGEAGIRGDVSLLKSLVGDAPLKLQGGRKKVEGKIK